MQHSTTSRHLLGLVVKPTVVIECPRLSKHFDSQITLISETFQITGSFKFRAAYNVVSKIKQDRLITASSGNFGQALSYACSLAHKTCTIVMPSNSSKTKVKAVAEYGGHVDLIDTAIKSRLSRIKELSALDPEAYVASPYDDPLVIEGNSSLGFELAQMEEAFDMIVVPIGGGGLASGIIQALTNKDTTADKHRVKIIGAEPLLANDAALSLKAGTIIRNSQEPQTIADGAKVLSVGDCNWPYLKAGITRIIEVSEAAIEEAVRLLFSLVNLKAEPTGALGLGALLANPKFFVGQRICCIVTGGNIDTDVFQQILSGSRKSS